MRRFSSGSRVLRICLRGSLVALLILSWGTAQAESGTAKPGTADALTEAMAKGDAAYKERSLQEAVLHYGEAAQAQPKNALVHARLAEALRAEGKLEDAFKAAAKGLRVAESLTMKGRLIFLQADIRERQKKYQQAQELWEVYLRLAGGGSSEEITIDLDAPEGDVVSIPAGETLYPSTATERLKQIAAALKREKDYAPVRERIQRREAEAQARSR